MTSDKYILVSLDEDKVGKIAEVIGNKTCKRILDILADEELSEKEISDRLNIPMNTVNYNVKKLKDSGLIEEKKHFFSVKGKRIPVYKVSNKSIVISPKKSSFFRLKNSLPVVVVASLFTGFMIWYEKTKSSLIETEQMLAETFVKDSISGEANKIALEVSFSFSPLQYFLIFIWIGIIAFVVWCYMSERRLKKYNGNFC